MKTVQEVLHDPETISRCYGDSLAEQYVLDAADRAILKKEFHISDDEVTVVEYLIGSAAHRFLEDERIAQRDLPRVRKQFQQAQKAFEQAASALQNLSGDAWEILNETAYGLEIAQRAGPTVRQTEGCRYLEIPTIQSLRTVPIKELEQTLTAFASAIEAAGPMSGKGKKGRPTDDAIDLLMVFIFHCWESVLKRKYTLEWDESSGPISEAAWFTLRICEIVDPSIAPSRMANAADKARKKCIRINSLEEPPAIVASYFQ